MTTIPSFVGYETFRDQVDKYKHSRFYGAELKDLSHDELIFLIGELDKKEPRQSVGELLTALKEGEFRTPESLAQQTGFPLTFVITVLDNSSKIRRTLFRSREGKTVYTTERLTIKEVVTALCQLITNRW